MQPTREGDSSTERHLSSGAQWNMEQSHPGVAGAMVTRKVSAMWFLAYIYISLSVCVWVQLRVQGPHTMFHVSFRINHQMFYEFLGNLL